SLGDSKTPLRFVLITVLANIVLDPLIISGIGMGIEGAAYATIFSQCGAFLYVVLYVLYNRLVPFRIPHLPTIHVIVLIFQLGIGAHFTVGNTGWIADVCHIGRFCSHHECRDSVWRECCGRLWCCPSFE